jgi:hypothetical protein
MKHAAISFLVVNFTLSTFLLNENRSYYKYK